MATLDRETGFTTPPRFADRAERTNGIWWIAAVAVIVVALVAFLSMRTHETVSSTAPAISTTAPAPSPMAPTTPTAPPSTAPSPTAPK